MLGRTRAPVKRSRARTSAKPPAKVHDLVFDMEVPLNEAIDHLVALRLITTSWAASQQLDTLKDIWNRILRRFRSRPART